VFNRSQSIQISDDKISTYEVLADQQLPILKTMVAPKVFSQQINHSPQYLNLFAQTLGFPLIVKEAFGSIVDLVNLIHTIKELRLHVVCYDVVSAMKRTSKNDFRSNITTGGTMEAYKPNTIEKELAIAGTKAIGADFAGVDLLFGKDGPIICEINSNAHIR